MIAPHFSSSFRCRILVAVAALALFSSTSLAQNKKDKDSLKKEAEQLFKPGSKDSSPSASPASIHWSIVIEGFRGDDQQEQAAKLLDRVRTDAGLKDAYIEKRGAATVVAFGRFPDGESKEARAALTRIQNTEVLIAGIKTKPFIAAFLAPPANIPGSMPEYDLREAKKRHGEWVLYTLQVAVYTRRDKTPTPAELAEFRKTAEMAVTRLRREGEQAFYYHGPKGSTVSIGLFGEDDFKPDEPGNESPALKALRQRHPHNLFNGQGMKETVTVTDHNGKQVKTTRIQPSGLVVVPKSD